MTDPTTPDPDPTSDPVEAELSAAAEEQLRALLRDDPVPDDELARERRIRAALDAFEPAPAQRPAAHRDPLAPSTTPVPVPRHRAGRGLLVAAAVLAVLGVGGLFVAGIARSGGEDSASTEAADSAAVSSTVDGVAGGAAEERSPAMEPPAAADGSGDESGSAAPTSTAAPDRSLASTDSVVDLGAHDDVAALLGSLGARDGDGVDTTRSTDPSVLPCVAQQRGAGIVVLGVATVGDELVVVIDAPSGPQVLDPASCAPR